MLIIEMLNANIQWKIKHLRYALNSVDCCLRFTYYTLSNKWKLYAQIIFFLFSNKKKSARKDTKNKSRERFFELNETDEMDEVSEAQREQIEKKMERKLKNPYSFCTPQTFDVCVCVSHYLSLSVHVP